MNDIGSAVSDVVKGANSDPACQRIALIDIDSCGVSRFDWNDIIPHLHAHYDLVVGFAKFSGRGPRDIFAAIDGSEEIDGHVWTGWATATQCDITFLTSDVLLGLIDLNLCSNPLLKIEDIPDIDTCCEKVNILLNEVVQALSSEAFRAAILAIPDARVVAVGQNLDQTLSNKDRVELVQRQRDILSRHIADANFHEPIMLSNSIGGIISPPSGDIWLFPLKTANIMADK